MFIFRLNGNYANYHVLQKNKYSVRMAKDLGIVSSLGLSNHLTITELKMTDLYSNPELIRSLFFYRDGKLYWKQKVSNRAKIGGRVGCQDSNGRLRFSYQNKGYSVHRVIYLMHHNTLPAVLDHIDGDYLNNRIENLREATQMQNCWNAKTSKKNKTGVKGTYWHPHYEQYLAHCMINGKRHKVGMFKELEEARIALEQFRAIHQGEFARNK